MAVAMLVGLTVAAVATSLNAVAVRSAGAGRATGPAAPVLDGPRGSPAVGYSGTVRGIALAGGSFNDGTLADGRTPMTADDPGVYGRDWYYDVDGIGRIDDTGLRFLADRGIAVIRVDFRWERLQPRIGGPLVSAEVRRITQLLDAAARSGLVVILDCHNYGHYKTAGAPSPASAQGGWPIGSRRVPAVALADLWRRIVRTWGAHPAVWGWELMNEPVAMGRDGGRRWRTASQHAVEAIRRAEPDGRHRAILVAGYDWSRVEEWPRINGRPWIDDPLADPDRLVYTAHHYWDGDRDSTYDGETPRELSGSTDRHAATVVAELRQFTAWLRRHRVRGAVTEVGWPSRTASSAWNRVADRWYDEADAARLHVTAWSAGAAWGDYELAVYRPRRTAGAWVRGDVIAVADGQAAVIERHTSAAKARR